MLKRPVSACLVGLASSIACGTENLIRPIRTIRVADEAWPYFNWASFDQDKILSYAQYQYTVYWDADKALVVVRRDLQTHQIQALRLPHYTLTIEPKDGHRNAVLGISPADGRLHVSWDHHVNDLRYTRTRKDFLTNPPGTMSEEDFEPAQSLAPGAPQGVTYPRFVNDGNGRLYFVYRSGGSGDGRTVIARYEAKDGKWSVSSGLLFGSEGSYEAWHNSRSRNAYLHDVLFDTKNRLHATWLYREIAGSWASNHDLHYAYSDDFGVTWMNNTGEQIADLSRNDAITIDDPGIVVQKIPVYSWVMNQCAMALDSHNQPHVALYKLPNPYKPEALSHDPSPDVMAQLRFFHYWRTVDGTWHSSGPLPMPAGLKIGRPNLVFDREDTLVLYWASDQGFHGYVAKAVDQWQTWSTYAMGDPNFTCSDASKHDRRLLREKGILSFTGNPNGTQPRKGFAIVDFDLQDFRSSGRP